MLQGSARKRAVVEVVQAVRSQIRGGDVGVRAEMIGDRGCLDDDPSDTGRRTARQSRRNARVMRSVEWVRLERGKN